MADRERLKLALPTGELRSDILRFFAASGFPVPVQERRYSSQVSGLPIDVVFMRAGMIPDVTYDQESDVQAGMTGNDLIWDALRDRNAGEKIDLSSRIEDSKRWSLVIAVTNAFAEKITQKHQRQVLVSDLAGTRMATERPGIVEDMKKHGELPDLKSHSVHGTDEAMPSAYPDCYSILGIHATGRTLDANGLRPLQIFYTGEVRLLTKPDGLNRRQSNILDDLREVWEVGRQRNRR